MSGILESPDTYHGDRVVTSEDLRAFLEGQGMEPSSRANSDWMEAESEIDGWGTRLAAKIEDSLLHLQLFLPNTKGLRGGQPEVTLLLDKINRTLRLPGFYLDDRGGRICYRISVPVENGGISHALLTTLLTTCRETAERHLPQIAGVAEQAGAIADATRVSTHGTQPKSKRRVYRKPNTGATRYNAVRNYLGRSNKDLAPQHTVDSALFDESEPTSDDPPLWKFLDIAVATEWGTGNVLGAIRADEYWIFENLVWRRLDESGFRQHLLQNANGPEISVRIGARESRYQNPLERLGFEPSHDEIQVERSLEEPLPQVDVPMAWDESRLLDKEFAERLIDGSANRALDGWGGADLVQLGCVDGAVGHSSHWKIAKRNGEVVGAACLLLSLQRDGAGLGFMGVLPKFRKQGLGRAMHAMVLRELKRLGASEYLDNTDERNVAMQRIFFRNGCRLTANLRRWRLLSRK